jgi:hypothetical protein
VSRAPTLSEARALAATWQRGPIPLDCSPLHHYLVLIGPKVEPYFRGVVGSRSSGVNARREVTEVIERELRDAGDRVEVRRMGCWDAEAQALAGTDDAIEPAELLHDWQQFAGRDYVCACCGADGWHGDDGVEFVKEGKA